MLCAIDYIHILNNYWMKILNFILNREQKMEKVKRKVRGEWEFSFTIFKINSFYVNE